MSARQRFARTGDAAYRVEFGPDARATVGLEPGSTPDETADDGRLGAQVESSGDGRVTLVVEGRLREAWVAEVGDRVAVFLEGEVFTFEVSDRPASSGRRRSRPDADSLSAPMPATVLRVMAQPGQRVARGEPLVLLEAMKMELPLKAPHDGVIKTVACAEGDLVQPGVVLVEMTEE